MNRLAPLFFAVWVFASCVNSTLDIKPNSLLLSQPSNWKSGRSWIEKMQLANGGRQSWLNLGTAKIILREEISKEQLARKPGLHEFNLKAITLISQLGTDNAQVEFISGPRKPEIWGLQNWVTYRMSGEKIDWTENKFVRSWIPSLDFFIHLPMRISEFKVQVFADYTKLSGTTYARIFASKTSAVPNEEEDQYLLWINTKTARLEHVEFTDRSRGKLARGFVAYEDYQSSREISVSRRLIFRTKMDGGAADFLRKIYIDSIEFAAILQRPIVFDVKKRANRHGPNP